MINDDNLSVVQQHKYCPKNINTWCRYWQDKVPNQGRYTEDNRLPSVFKSKLKYLFDRLSDEDLVKRCMLSLTQNQNESINNVLWFLCTKRTFCGFRKLSLCVAESVSKFNCGVGTKAVVLRNIGCEPTRKMLTALRADLREDHIRNDHSERKIHSETRINRQKWRSERKLKTKSQPTAYLSRSFGLSAQPETLKNVELITPEPITITFIDETKAVSSDNRWFGFC